MFVIHSNFSSAFDSPPISHVDSHSPPLNDNDSIVPCSFSSQKAHAQNSPSSPIPIDSNSTSKASSSSNRFASWGDEKHVAIIDNWETLADSSFQDIPNNNLKCIMLKQGKSSSFLAASSDNNSISVELSGFLAKLGDLAPKLGFIASSSRKASYKPPDRGERGCTPRVYSFPGCKLVCVAPSSTDKPAQGLEANLGVFASTLLRFISSTILRGIDPPKVVPALKAEETKLPAISVHSRSEILDVIDLVAVLWLVQYDELPRVCLSYASPWSKRRMTVVDSEYSSYIELKNAVVRNWVGEDMMVALLDKLEERERERDGVKGKFYLPPFRLCISAGGKPLCLVTCKTIWPLGMIKKGRDILDINFHAGPFGTKNDVKGELECKKRYAKMAAIGFYVQEINGTIA
ncbi:hypothetical protein LguiA_029589 [Lonicera macranthoides]